MKSLKQLWFAIILAVSSNAVLAADQVVMNPYGTLLSSSTLEVELAQFAQKNKDGLYDVLMKIRGSSAFIEGIDGKTIKYQAVPAAGGVDYVSNGVVRMTLRQPMGDTWSVMEVMLAGKRVPVRLQSGMSQDIQPLHMLTEFESNKK